MTFREFWQPLTSIYPEDEARWIGRVLFEMQYGLTHADLLMGREENVSDEELLRLQRRLLDGEPVQYVVGRTVFCGRPFSLTPAVLIPRPETEELCRLCKPDGAQEWRGRVLDIGTGSGCIAVTLAADMPHAEVTAWDISEKVLDVARTNAINNNVRVDFQKVDVLGVGRHETTGLRWDIIVSNPPYVCDSERSQMAAHVLRHEPWQALFVPDDDPMLFYRAIGSYALLTLTTGGHLLFEVNERHATDTAHLMLSMGFKGADVVSDQFGKQRFVRVCR